MQEEYWRSRRYKRHGYLLLQQRQHRRQRYVQNRGRSERARWISTAIATIWKVRQATTAAAREKVTSAQLQNLDISDAFTHVSGINQGYPVLLWQDLQPIVGDAQLAEDTDFVTEKVHIPSFVEVNDEESYRLATPEVRWKAVDGAEQYALTLWEKALVEKEGDVEN